MNNSEVRQLKLKLKCDFYDTIIVDRWFKLNFGSEKKCKIMNGSLRWIMTQIARVRSDDRRLDGQTIHFFLFSFAAITAILKLKSPHSLVGLMNFKSRRSGKKSLLSSSNCGLNQNISILRRSSFRSCFYAKISSALQHACPWSDFNVWFSNMCSHYNCSRLWLEIFCDSWT